jgi:hypothetical protein
MLIFFYLLLSEFIVAFCPKSASSLYGLLSLDFKKALVVVGVLLLAIGGAFVTLGVLVGIIGKLIFLSFVVRVFWLPAVGRVLVAIGFFVA